jgi:hypothetical protein
MFYGDGNLLARSFDPVDRRRSSRAPSITRS